MSDPERTLYCGNLSEKVTENILYELFLQAGPLESVKIPKDKDGKQRNYGFVTFKHPVSVPYTVALMNGITLYGKPLRLDARTGVESDRNPYLEKIMQYRSSLVHPNMNRNYNSSQWEPYDENFRRYDSRRYESSDSFETNDYNSWNMQPGSIPQSYISGSPNYSNQMQNQGRFIQNSHIQSQIAYPSHYGNKMPWTRNHR